jgi:hypothetical protein
MLARSVEEGRIVEMQRKTRLEALGGKAMSPR